MFGGVIGLDLGHTSLKLALCRRSLTGRVSVTSIEQALPAPEQAEAAPPSLPAALRELFQSHRLTGLPVVSALPGQSLLWRTLVLPFDDPAKVARVVPSEVENLLPFPLDELALAYRLFPEPVGKAARAGRSCTVLVAAVQKKDLRGHLDLLAEAGIRPVGVVPDGMALWSACAASVPLEDGQAHALIDLGATHTTVCVCHATAPPMLRAVDLGGWHLPGIPAATAPVEDAFEKGPGALFLDALVHELRLVFHAYEAQVKHPVVTVCLTGGAAQLPGLRDALNRRLGCDIRTPPHDPRFSIAHGLATAPARVRAASLLDFSAAAPLDAQRVHSRQRVRRLAAGLAAIVLLAAGDVGVRYYVKETRYQGLKQELRQRLLGQFPDAPVVDPLSQMKTALADATQQLRLLGADDPLVLPLLADLSRRLATEAPLQMHGLVVERRSIQLEAETNSFESVDVIKRALARAYGGGAVQTSDVRASAGPGRVAFKATIVPPASVE